VCTHDTLQQGTLIDGVECVRHWCRQDGAYGQRGAQTVEIVVQWRFLF
jgi:hypothetical protein